MSTTRSEQPSTALDRCSEPSPKRPRLGPETPKQQPSREFGLMRNTSGEYSASFVGSASGIYFIRSVYSALASNRDLRKSAQIQTPDSDVVPGEDDQLPQRATNSGSRNLWRDGEVSIPAVPGHLDEVTFEDLLAWTESYFDHWHPAYPFLHAPSILDFFKTLAQGSRAVAESPSSSSKLIILRSIMSISLADHRQSGAPMARPVPAYLAFHSFDDAMNSISKVFSNPTSIESIQAAVSVQLFLVSMLRHNAASRLGGAIVRMAFQLGLHRCPVRFSGFSAQDASLRKRLFWTIYCLDRYICQSIGLPLAIRDDDVDVCYAGQERHIQGGPNLPDMTPVDSTTTAYQPPGPDQRLHLLDFLTRHAEIRGQIMELRNKSISHSQADNDRAVAIDAEISKWWNEVDEWLDSHNSSSLFVTSSHKTALAILRYESIIALKRPILATPSQNSAYRAALQDCVNASRSVISILHKALKRITLSELGRDASSIQHAIPLNWPSYTWVVWMSAFMIIHAANEREFPAELAIRITDRSLEILKNLSLRGSVWPGTCAIAIRDLRNRLEERQKRQALEQSSQEENGLRSRSTSRAMTPSTAQLRSNGSRSYSNDGPNTQLPTRAHEPMTPSYPHLIPDGNTGVSMYSGNGFQNTDRPQPRSNDQAWSDFGPSQQHSQFRNFHPDETNQSNYVQQFELSRPSSQSLFSGFLHGNDQGLSIDEMMNQMGAQTSNDTMQLLNPGGTDLFCQFDIPFWMGDDQASNIGNGWS